LNHQVVAPNFRSGALRLLFAPIVETVASLQRRERMIATVRWVAIVFALGQVTLYEPPATRMLETAAAIRPWAFAVVGALLGVALFVEFALRIVHDVRALQALGAGVLAADLVISVAFIYLYSFDQLSAPWTLLVVLPLEGALRFELRGALAVWAALLPIYLGSLALGSAVHHVRVSVGASFYRMGLLLVVALFGGFIVRDLNTQRRLLQRLNDASHQVASRLEPAEILQTLCREAVRCLGAESAVVYVYDGSWFHPVASYPVGDLVKIMQEDEHEREDASLVPLLMAEPAWLEADSMRPGRLAVPLRWQSQTTTNLMVIRPLGGRPTPFETDIAASLAESAALSLATTRVIAAEQRNVRRLRYLEAIRTRFVATIAHDLRMPLTVFKGVSQMLRRRREEISPEQVDQMLTSVERQANRLSRLADDLLDAARLEGEVFSLHLETFQVATIVDAIVADLDGEVTVDVEPGLQLVGDAPRLERVLWNLLSNAEKYGKPPFEISGRRDDDTVVLSVRDHGQGVEEAQRARLFGEFTGSDDPESVGLGLAIVWQLVQAHGGEVRYRDASPGACFEVCLPVDGPKDASAGQWS
jgi:K+-sensing histidine kinase KdpD